MSFLRPPSIGEPHLQMIGAATNKQPLAYASVMLEGLRTGYRALQLHCPATGAPIESCMLLLKTKLEKLPLETGSDVLSQSHKHLYI